MIISNEGLTTVLFALIRDLREAGIELPETIATYDFVEEEFE